MKISLTLLSALFLLTCCADDNDNDNGFPKRANIEIMINASDTDRFSEIETIIYGVNLELRTNSYANTHLPFKRTYINQEIPDLSGINITFKDHSAVPIGAAFEPYTMEILVEIDDQIAISEQYTIDKQQYAASVSLSLTEYFANR